MTNTDRKKSYYAIREMVRFHPRLGQHTLLVQSIMMMQKICNGFTVMEALTLLEQAENDLNVR